MSQYFPSPFVDSCPWRLRERPGSGLFVESQNGTLLFRLDIPSGMIYLWDRQVKREIPVSLKELLELPIKQI